MLRTLYIDVDETVDITPDPRAEWVKLLATRKDDLWAAIELLQELDWDVNDVAGPDLSSDLWRSYLYRRNKHR